MPPARQPDSDRWKYARACLEQGMGYAATAMAAGLHEPSIRSTFPGFGRRATGKPPVSAAPNVFEECADFLPEASPKDCRKVAALALALLSEQSGPEAAMTAMVNIAAALPTVRVRQNTEADPVRVLSQEVILQVAEVFRVDARSMFTACRTKGIARPRQAAMYCIRQLCPHLSFPEIGRRLGGRDHTTIIHGVRKIEALMETDEGLAEKVRAVLGHFDRTSEVNNLLTDALRFRLLCDQYGAVMKAAA